MQQERFSNNADKFIEYEAQFPNHYLLSKTIDAKEKIISLVFGGKEITPGEIAKLKTKLKQYGMENDSLEIKQGFAYLAPANNNNEQDERYTLLSNALALKEKEESTVQAKLDNLSLILN